MLRINLAVLERRWADALQAMDAHAAEVVPRQQPEMELRRAVCEVMLRPGPAACARVKTRLSARPSGGGQMLYPFEVKRLAADVASKCR
jgi:hypothetical protein